MQKLAYLLETKYLSKSAFVACCRLFHSNRRANFDVPKWYFSAADSSGWQHFIEAAKLLLTSATNFTACPYLRTHADSVFWLQVFSKRIYNLLKMASTLMELPRFRWFTHEEVLPDRLTLAGIAARPTNSENLFETTKSTNAEEKNRNFSVHIVRRKAAASQI